MGRGPTSPAPFNEFKIAFKVDLFNFKYIYMELNQMDFNAMIQRIVANEITKQLETYTAAQLTVEEHTSGRNKSEYLSIEELSELTGLKKATIYAKRSRREIPAYKFGRELRFKRSEVDAWINSKQLTCLANREGGDR